MRDDLGHLGRAQLLELIKEQDVVVLQLIKQSQTATADRDAYLDNLTSTQERCTALMLENRALKAEMREQVLTFERYVNETIEQRDQARAEARYLRRVKHVYAPTWQQLSVDARNEWLDTARVPKLGL